MEAFTAALNAIVQVAIEAFKAMVDLLIATL